MKNMTCVRVGHGAVAAIHDSKFHPAGASVVGVLDSHPDRRRQAAEAGYTVYTSYLEAQQARPSFWDVCVNTASHVEVLARILAVNPAAHVMIEKPVCNPCDIPLLRGLLQGRARGRIAVNENYGASAVTATVKRLAFEHLGLRVHRIVVEMTKNRLQDFARGRFLDHELAALGYEGPHMLAILRDLGAEYLPALFTDVTFEDAIIASPGGRRVLFGQGGAWVRAVSCSGAVVELYTSMNGDVKHGYSLSGQQGAFHIEEGSSTRHRVLIVEGTDRQGRETTVAGLYEPVRGMARSVGAVLVLRDGAVVHKVAPIPDDTMGTQVSRILRYFQGTGENPGDVETGIRTVELLSEARARWVEGAYPREAHRAGGT